MSTDAVAPQDGTWAWWRTFEHFSAPGSNPVAVSVDRHLVEREMDGEATTTRKAHVLGSWTGERWTIWGKRSNGHTERMSARQRLAYDRARAGGSWGNLGPVPPASELTRASVHLDAARPAVSSADILTSVYIGPELRPWQRDALTSWQSASEQGIVEAVTGTGKTAVGIAAIAEAAAVGRRAVVLVPTIGLQRQWVLALSKGLDRVRIGSVGGGASDSWQNSDVIVSTIHSAFDRGWLADRDTLLVADEVHRYGAETFASALSPTYRSRLGLTATLERSDDGVEEVLLPYFQRTIDGCSYRRAYDDGILAPVCVALVGVDLTPQERERFESYEEDFSRAWRNLVTRWGADDSTFGSLMADANRLAAGGGDPRATGTARWFLKSFSNRRELLAGCENKSGFVDRIARVVPHAERSLIFSDQIDTARAAADTLAANGSAAVALTSEVSSAEREGILAEFRAGHHDVLCAPRILDEGIDVPAVDFAAVLAASKTRRQMIQRVGRVIRPKPGGRNAVFAIAYVKGTGEDPDRGGHVAFLEEFLEVAREVEMVDVDSAVPLLISWLGGREKDPSAEEVPSRIVDVEPGHDGVKPSTASETAIDEPRGVDPRELVLTIFDDYEQLATFDEVLVAVSETHDTSLDTARWEIAGADLGDGVTWVSIAGVMVGCGGTGRSTAAIRAQMLQSFDDCVRAYRESGGMLGVSALKATTEGTLLAAVSVERLAELIEAVGDEPRTDASSGVPGRNEHRISRVATSEESADSQPDGEAPLTGPTTGPASEPEAESAPASPWDSRPARLKRHRAWVKNRRRTRDRRKGDS